MKSLQRRSDAHPWRRWDDPPAGSTGFAAVPPMHASTQLVAHERPYPGHIVVSADIWTLKVLLMECILCVIAIAILVHFVWPVALP